MNKPTRRTYDKHRKTSWLFFDDAEPMEVYVKGGICFPEKYKTSEGIKTNGYAVLGCQDIKTQKVYIFEQMSWVTIDDILEDESNQIKWEGLSHWFNKCWTEYFGSNFYFCQEDELTKRYRIQISRSPMINPKPVMIETIAEKRENIIGNIWHWVMTERVRMQESELHAHLIMTKEDDTQFFPAVHALGCCLMAFERSPWREPKPKPLEEILIPWEAR